MDQKARVFSVFPACGKTYIYENQEEMGIKVLDSDSSNFSWIINENGEKVRNPDFPANYIKHIKENLNSCDYIFVSTHEEVRDALIQENIPLTIVFPNLCCHAEWVGRCYIREKRGEHGCSAEAMYKNFPAWVASCVYINNPGLFSYIVLRPGEYLSDYI